MVFAAFFLHVNEYKKRAVQKVVFGSCVLLCIGMIGQLAAGMSDFTVANAYMDGYKNHLGGGVFCGSAAYLLHKGVGLVGTYIIIILVMILCVVLFAEVSVIELVKSFMVEMKEIRREEEDYDTEEEFEETRPSRRKVKKQPRADFDEIVTEDFSAGREEIFKGRKKTSMLDSISVLPADSDKGILPSKTVDKFPKDEEVHEITMEYTLDLPGENMGEFSVTEVSKEAVKESAPKRSRKKKAKPVNVENIVTPTVSGAAKVENEMITAPPSDVMNMEKPDDMTGNSLLVK